MAIESKNKELLERRILNKRKRKPSIIILLLLVAIIGGYIFFYMSPAIFHMESQKLYTPLGERVSLDENISFSVKEWKYSVKQNLMEVVLNVSNQSIYTSNSDLEFYAFVNKIERVQKREQLSVDIKLNDYNLISLWIMDVPKDFNTCTLIITTSEQSTSDEQKNVEVYSNRETVTRVNEIKKMEYKDYIVEEYEKTRDKLNKNITANNNRISTAEKEIEVLREQIEETRAKEIYMTEKDIEEAEENVSSLKKEINSKNEEIARIKADNSALREEIEMYEKLIEKIKNGENQSEREESTGSLERPTLSPVSETTIP